MSPSANREFAVDVVRQLQAAGHEAVWAGGCVRDQCLHQKPKDYDVATSAVPDQVRAVFGKSRTWAVGESFGVIVVRGPRGVDQIEVATFRIDGGYSDGRRPDSVQFSSAEEDARRRDFTINGMFFDPLSEAMIDYVGGQADLDRRIVRAIGDPDERFSEDKLRMLRAVRFAAKLQFELEEKTLAAIQDRPTDIHIVSGERVGNEMSRMLTDVHCSDAVRLLMDSRLMPEVLPEAMTTLGTRETMETAGTRATIALRALEIIAPCSLAQALTLLLRDWDHDDSHLADAHLGDSSHTAPRDKYRSVANVVAERWRLTNHDKSLLSWLLEHEPFIRVAQDLPWPQVQRILVNDNAGALIELAGVIAKVIGSTGQSEHVDFCRAKRESDPADWNPDPLLNGDDLRNHGVAPGPIFKELLTEVRDAQLNGTVSDRAGAWELVNARLDRD